MITAVVIDDESRARETIINILGLNPKEVQVIGEAENIESGYELIETKKPDLVFLDINLTDGTGFELIKRFDKIYFKLIFITAHEEYAIKAFKFSALDYILKPVTASDLLKAVEKAIQIIRKDETEMKFSAFLSNLDKIKKIVLKTSESIHIVNIKDIIRCESDVNYTTFFLTNKTKLLVSKPLKDYTELLTQSGFFRTHQSHLVNLDHISRYDKEDGGHLVMDDTSIVPVSSRKKEMLFEVFENM